MYSRIRIVQDFEECAFLWKTYYPVECLFDLWRVRESFAKFYKREPYFIVYEENGKVDGLIPLCKSYETSKLLFFPGEVWKNRTWMEQNKIIAENSSIMFELLSLIKSAAKNSGAKNSISSEVGHNKINNDNFSTDIRYLSIYSTPSIEYLKDVPSEFNADLSVDEKGYLFYPKQYSYSYENYLGAFAGKSRKKILSEVKSLEKQGISFRYNHFDDLDVMFNLNISNFGENGYFHDIRFLNSFIELANNLNKNGMLRVVTVLINNEIAAVDMGAVWSNKCIMLAGGTNKNFPGIAKLINLHHIEWACSAKIDSIDFLCGDFGWKERFHLTPRELYQIIF